MKPNPCHWEDVEGDRPTDQRERTKDEPCGQCGEQEGKDRP